MQHMSRDISPPHRSRPWR